MEAKTIYHVEATDNGYVAKDNTGWSSSYTDENFREEFGKILTGDLMANAEECNYIFNVEITIRPAKSLLFPDE